MNQKTINISMFMSQRAPINHSVRLLKDGCFAVRGHCTFDYHILTESFNCELIVKSSLFNKIIEWGVVEIKDNRYYYSDNAPKLEFN